MAIVLKASKTYSPSNSYGLDLTSNSFYGVIDKLEYDKQNKFCGFTVEIYADQTARSGGRSPLDRLNFTFSGDDFDSQIGVDGLTIPNAYTKALVTLTDWESDEV